MWAKHREQKGFTIVELLIVIVVIAILAAISIVAYNGVQSRSKNQQTVSAVRTYYSALKAYGIDNNALPTNTGCLGQANFYTSNPCYIGSNTYNYNAALNSSLDPYINSAPTLPSGRAVSGSTSGSGIFYYNSTNSKYIGFPIYSASSCPDIAGATYSAQAVFGSDIYCRLDFPSI